MLICCRGVESTHDSHAEPWSDLPVWQPVTWTFSHMCLHICFASRAWDIGSVISCMDAAHHYHHCEHGTQPGAKTYVTPILHPPWHTSTSHWEVALHSLCMLVCLCLNVRSRPCIYRSKSLIACATVQFAWPVIVWTWKQYQDVLRAPEISNTYRLHPYHRTSMHLVAAIRKFGALRCANVVTHSKSSP